MPRHATQIGPGDQGVIIRANGRIDAVLHDANLDDVGQALLGAAFKVANDPVFRQQQVAAFRLYHTQVEGFA